MICARCGQENPAGFRFCGACGAPLEADAAPRELRKTVTVLFCDLTGSTALGDRLDPEAYRTAMQRYHAVLRSAAERHGGSVEKFIGDAVMAVFGVPQAHEDDAVRAVRAAAEMREAVVSLGLEARIGVNTGEVVVGEGETLATGDAVNVAARLEQHAATGEILIGPETQRLVRDAVTTEPVELVVKGKAAPLEAHRVLDIDRAAAGVARRLDSPLVGRRRELQRIRDDFEDTAATRSSHLFTLLGPAGVGKSRLVAEFVGEVSDRARIVRGRCLHYGEGITYWPLVEVLLQLGADAETVLGQPSPTEAAVATRKLLEANAREQPLIVVFDDIQWAEPTFLELIEHVVDWARSAPIFVLCIARPELLELRSTWGGGRSNATSLLLDPLGADDAHALMENLRGDAALPEATRTRIVEASGGNPLFVEEMLLMLRDEGDHDVAVPPTIHALLQARLDRLGDGERSVIERGAVEGEVFHRAPVAQLAPMQVRSGLDTHLTTLIRNELIRPEAPTMPGDDAFRFRHLLIRDAAYEALPKEMRADLHERFAIWLDEHVTLVEQDEIVGYHLEQAVRYRRELGRDDEPLARRAAARIGRAGRAAIGRGDNVAGHSLLGRAVALVPPGDSARLALLPPLGWVLWELGRFDEMRSLADELEASPDDRWRAYATVVRIPAEALGGTGSFGGHEAELAAAREAFERLGDDAGLARAIEFEANVEWTACRAATARQLYRRALEHAERSGDVALAESARGMLVTVNTHGPTPVAEAEREIARILESSRGMIVESSAQRALGRLAAMRGDFDTARTLVTQGRAPLADAGFHVWWAGTTQAPAMVEQIAGDLEAEIDFLRQGFDRLRELGEHAFASTNASELARALLELGRDDEAAAWVETARELSPLDDASTLATADAVAAVLAARAGELDEADALGARALERSEQTDFWPLRGCVHNALAEVHLRAGRRDEARAALLAALDVYESKGVVPLADRVRARLTTL